MPGLGCCSSMQLIIMLGAALLSLGGCHRPQPSDVGAQSQKDASADAMTKASERAYRAQPESIPASATGLPVQVAPQH